MSVGGYSSFKHFCVLKTLEVPTLEVTRVQDLALKVQALAVRVWDLGSRNSIKGVGFSC